MSPWGGVTGKFTKNATFSASAATEDWDGTVTANFECHYNPYSEKTVFYFGFADGDFGSLSSTTWKNNKGSIRIYSIYGSYDDSSNDYEFHLGTSSNKTGCTSVKLLINGYTQTVVIDDSRISRRKLNTGDMIDWFIRNADDESGEGEYTIKYKFV